LKKLLALLLAVYCATPLDAGEVKEPGDWPGWRGPDRTGVSTETGLLKEWPRDGPKLLWKATELGGGYSTPSVAGGRVFLMGSQGDEEFVHALDVKDGRLLWSTKVGAVGENTGPSYPGPRSTPTVDGDRLYTLGSDGDLVCARTTDGKIVWRHHLEKEFEGNRGTWAYAESVLIDGDTLVCTPGGESATLLALNKKDGSVRWKAKVPGGNQAGYASVVIAEVGGVRQYIQFLGSGVVSVATRDGRFLWRYKGNVGGVSSATPIVHDGCVFTTSSGTTGAGGDALLRLIARGGNVAAKEVYLVRSITNFHGGVLRIGDYLYGCNSTGLVCVHFKTGARKWHDRSVGRGSLVAADGHLYLRSERGAVALIEATPAGYKEKGRFEQPGRSRFPAFVHPVVAGGRLYLRDAGVLLCYDVKGK
jgi:outer membrane protein assembly factor BamB